MGVDGADTTTPDRRADESPRAVCVACGETRGRGDDARRCMPPHTVTYRYTYLEQAEDLDLAQAQLITGCHGAPPVAEQAVISC